MAEQKKDQGTEKKKDWGFERLPNGNLKGTLQDGVKVGEDTLYDFELRPCTAGDMFDAENEASAAHYFSYQGALISRQLVRLGNIDGPVDVALIRKLKPRDLGQLLDAVEDVELPGKPSSTDSKATTADSSSSA